MPIKIGKKTVAEVAEKFGIPLLPKDDPLHSNKWHIGATVPYKYRPASSVTTTKNAARPSKKQK